MAVMRLALIATALGASAVASLPEVSITATDDTIATRISTTTPDFARILQAATTMTTTSAPRCGKKKDQKAATEDKLKGSTNSGNGNQGLSRRERLKKLLNEDKTVWLDAAFYWGSNLAFWAFASIVSMFGATLLLCGFVMCIDRCRKKETSTLAPCYPIFTSYYGLLYGLYILTVPIFGRPRPQGRKGACGLDKSWFYPESPHLSPVPPTATKRRMFLKLLINGIILVLCPYISILVWITLFGVLFTYPMSLTVLFILLLICRMADKVDMIAEKQIKDNLLQKKMELKDQGGGHEGGPGAPGGAGFDFDLPAPNPPGCCQLALGYFGLVFGLIFQAFITVMKMFFDLILLLSIADTWPSLNLPNIQMSPPNFGMADIGLPNFPCIGFPAYNFFCRFPAQVYAIFVLLSTLVCVCVVVSSDIMVLLYDRIDRCKQTKLNIFDKNERFAAIRHNFFIQLLTVCTFLVWKAVEVIISTSSGAFLETARIFTEMAGYDGCSETSEMMAKVLGCFVLSLVVMQLLRVGNGHVQNNLVYVCAVPLADTQFSLCGRQQWKSLLSIVKLSIGSFLMPFINLGLRHGAIDKVAAEIQGNNKDGHLTFEEAFKQFDGVEKEDFKRRKVAAKESGSGFQVIKVYMDSLFYKMFGAGTTLCATIMAVHQRWLQCRNCEMLKEDNLGVLEVGAVSVEDWIFAHKIAHAQRKNATWITGFKTMFKLFFGVFDTDCMSNMRCLGRSNLWQAQIEAVKQASGNYFGITLQVIPFFGIFLGKACMYLNEYPTWIVTKKQTFGCRSLRWGAQKPGELRPSPRLIILYLCSLTKVCCLFAAFFTGKVTEAFLVIFIVALFEAVVGGKLKEKYSSERNPIIMYNCELWEDKEEVERKKKKKEASLGYKAGQGLKKAGTAAVAPINKVLNETANVANDGADDEEETNSGSEESEESEESGSKQAAAADDEEEVSSGEEAEPLPGSVRDAGKGAAAPSAQDISIAAGVKATAEDAEEADSDEEGA